MIIQKVIFESDFVPNLPQDRIHFSRQEFRSMLNSNNASEYERSLKNIGALSEELNSQINMKLYDLKFSSCKLLM